MAMWQHTLGVYVWRSVWRCKLDCVQFKSRSVRYHKLLDTNCTHIFSNFTLSDFNEEATSSLSMI